jgi:hypothetical protein
MTSKVSNFSDLIQRVAASCLLHPLAAGRHDSGENRSADEDEEYESDDQEDEEDEGSEEEEEKERCRAWEGTKEEVRVERMVEMERLMSEVFDAVSAMKRAYVGLQESHCPWDPEKMRVADVAVVAELRRLGVLRERFRRRMRRGCGGGGVCCTEEEGEWWRGSEGSGGAVRVGGG